MTDEKMYNEIDEMMDFETNEEIKGLYRKSRRSKRLEKKKNQNQKNSINCTLGASKTKCCKKLSHKRNRRETINLYDSTTKCKYAFQNRVKYLTSENV